MANKNTNILNASELLEIYGTPVFSDAECSEYFRLSPAEIKVLKSFKDVSNSMHFVICLVFFKLNKTLVDFSYRETTAQRRHVMERYFPNSSTPKTTVKDKNTIARIENTVLSLCDHQRYQGEIAVLIQQELQKQAQNNPRQRQLCKALLDLLTKHQVAIPGYTTVQNIISTVSNRENNRLIKTYVRYTNKTDRDSILSLMTKDDDGLHHIVSIRQDMRGFNTTELNKEIDKHIKLQPIFEAAINVIPKLNLPTATINYYASLINYYTAPRLKQINTHLMQLYLLCYCFTRYQVLNDNLLEAHKKRTLDYKSKGKENANEQRLNQLDLINDLRKRVGNLLISIKDHPNKTHIDLDPLFTTPS